jgi:hypothetical protein
MAKIIRMTLVEDEPEAAEKRRPLPKNRYCKICAQLGRETKLSNYNLNKDRCFRHVGEKVVSAE